MRSRINKGLQWIFKGLKIYDLVDNIVTLCDIRPLERHFFLLRVQGSIQFYGKLINFALFVVITY
jgi:hypothetical protein